MRFLRTTRLPGGSFPVALLFFVVPQSAVAGHPVLATQAVASMCVFSVIVGSLFSFPNWFSDSL